ncbi:MAG: PspA/IM30 family protein [Myxococcota bacterium]|nr:PspA/IM30 family protein [Myxococcota bacterium]
MRFLDRLALALKADAHGVMDQLEERSLLVKQHLREAELDLTRKRARAEAFEEEERRLEEEVRRLDTRVEALDEDVELALSGGKDDLARFALRRLLPLRQNAREKRLRIAELRESRARLVERLEAQETELDALRTRARARIAAAEAREAEPARSENLGAVADEQVELELLRRRRPEAREEGTA